MRPEKGGLHRPAALPAGNPRTVEWMDTSGVRVEMPNELLRSNAGYTKSFYTTPVPQRLGGKWVDDPNFMSELRYGGRTTTINRYERAGHGGPPLSQVGGSSRGSSRASIVTPYGGGGGARGGQSSAGGFNSYVDAARVGSSRGGQSRQGGGGSGRDLRSSSGASGGRGDSYQSRLPSTSGGSRGGRPATAQDMEIGRLTQQLHTLKSSRGDRLDSATRKLPVMLGYQQL
jgi:hypothetical protein